MQLEDITSKTLLIGLFFICIVAFATSIGSNYSRPDMIPSQLSTTSIEQSINSTNQLALKWKQAFQSSSPLISVGLLAIQSLWNIGNTAFNTILNVFALYLITVGNIFGIPPIVIGVISSILIISLIVAVYKFIKG